ncbi:MAG TPA: methyl-accepting chemotaxis protein [Syntrophomonadaceae bacterium]|nr:methyl-accepting chemotaxis protein [Syntrophomonadaceae bacterium]
MRLEEDSKTFEQADLLLEAMNQIAAGQIGDPVKMENFSGIWLKLAASTEAIRQLVFNFYCELQVTDAQVASSKEQIGETMKMVDGLALAFHDLKSDAAQMERDTQGLNDTLNSGQSTIEKTGAVIEFVQASSDEISRIMHDANDRLDALIPVIGQTDNILAQIDQINNHIKMLSFNAAIEAARAGTHGSGFTVVAQEMKRLSEQSYDSVKKTGKITGQMKREIEQLVTTMNGSQEQVHATFTKVYREVKGNLQAQQHTVSEIIGDIADNKEKIERYTQQLNRQFSLWVDALDSLKTSSRLFEKIEEALTTTLAKVAPNGAVIREVSDDSLSWILEQLQELVHHEAIRDLNPFRHKEVLSSFFNQRNSTVEAIYTTNAEGSFLFSEPAAGLANARVRPWWQEAMAGKIYKSPIYISAITRKPCLTIALPIPGRNGGESGVLGVDLTVRG